jgi:hypothetical protein
LYWQLGEKSARRRVCRMNVLYLNVADDDSVEMPEEEAESFRPGGVGQVDDQ